MIPHCFHRHTSDVEVLEAVGMCFAIADVDWDAISNLWIRDSTGQMLIDGSRYPMLHLLHKAGRFFALRHNASMRSSNRFAFEWVGVGVPFGKCIVSHAIFACLGLVTCSVHHVLMCVLFSQMLLSMV